MPIDLTNIPDAKEKSAIDLSVIPDAGEITFPGVGIPWEVGPDSLRSRIPEDAERDELVKRLMKQEWQNARDTGSLYPVAEMAAHIITGIYGNIIGGLGAIHPETIAKTIIYDKDFMSEALKEAEDLLVYKPQTEGGIRLTRRGAYPFELLHKFAKKKGDEALKSSGSAAWATFVSTMIEAAPPLLIMGRAFKPRIMEGLGRSKTWRNISMKSRSKVWSSMEEAQRQYPNASEGEILRHSKKLYEERVAMEVETARRTKAAQEMERAESLKRGEAVEAAPEEVTIPEGTIREAYLKKVAKQEKIEGRIPEPPHPKQGQIDWLKRQMAEARNKGNEAQLKYLETVLADVEANRKWLAEGYEKEKGKLKLVEPPKQGQTEAAVGMKDLAPAIRLPKEAPFNGAIFDAPPGTHHGPAAEKAVEKFGEIGDRVKIEYGYLEPDGKFITQDAATKKYGPGTGPEKELLSEDIANARNVFDEVLEEIEKPPVRLAEEDIRIPIPKEPIKPEAITEYEQLAGEAARRALEKVEEYYKKEEVKIWKEAKREAKPFVEEDPIYAMQSEIVEAGGINRQSMIDNDVTATDIADLNRKRPRLVTQKGKLSADTVAGQMGYDTVDAMVQDWKMRPTKKVMMEKVAAQMADEMLIGLDATRDIEFQGLVAEEEAKILSTLLGKKPKARPGFRVMVDKLTGVIPIKDAVNIPNVRLALKDAIRARARVAREAFSAGKKEAALKAKEEQITKLAKLRATAEARKALNKTKALLKKAKKGVRKMRKGPGANIQRLLDELDPVKLSQRKRLELEEWAEFVEENPEVELSQKAWVDIKRLDKTPLADLTMAQLENVRDYILHQFHVSRSINKIITKRREYETDVAARGAVDLMPPPPKNTLLKTLPPRKYERKKFKERISYIFGLGQEGYDLMIESLGGKESPAWDILADNLFESRNAELRIVDTALTKYGKAADAIYKKHKIRRPSKWLWEEVKTGPHTFVRAERVSLYRHTLNEDNLIAILEGGYAKRFAENPFALKGMEMDELKAIINDLSPAEKALAEGPMTDFFNYFGKKMAVVFYEKNGYPMILIEPGKYYPKHVVPTSRTTALDAEKDNAVEKFRNTGFTRIGVDRSNTIDRVGSKKPIYINPFWYDMVRFAQRNATYITYEMPLTAASRLMNHPLFKNDMLTKYPPNLYAEIHKGLRDIAGRYMNYDLFEESVMRLKNNLSVAVLGGLNFRVMLRQTLSAPLYLLYVRPHHWVRGYIESIFNPRRVKQAHLENSPKYKERVESGFSRDTHDVFRDKNWKKILGKRHMSKKDAYMVGIRGMDKVAVKPGMQAAVTDVLAQIRRGKFNRRVKYHLQVDDSIIPKLDAGEKLGLAYKYADTATAEAQPMFLPEYWSALQRGGPGTKLFTMFGSFTNRALGQLKRSYRRFKGAKTAADRAYWGHQWIKTVFMLTVVNSFLLTFTDYLWHRFAGRDPEKFNWWIRMISAPAGFWFFIRDFVFSLQTHVEGGGFQGLDPSIPLTHWASQGVDGLYSGLAAATTDDPDLAKKHTKRALDRTAEFLLHMRGMPYGPTKRTIMSITKERE